MKSKTEVSCKIIITLFALVLFSVKTSTRTNYAELQEQGPTTDSASAKIYEERCAMCHDKPKARIPPRSQIARQSAEDVIATLTTGTMKQWGDGLTADQIRALAVYVTGNSRARAFREI